MDNITIETLHSETRRIIERVKSGEQLILTYEGKPVMRLEPLQEDQVRKDEGFYELPEMAMEKGESISNEKIDRIVYEREN
jgi:antitoxin (DNA-binding transcriptional repressor) of toxin-antitoxin stability system